MSEWTNAQMNGLVSDCTVPSSFPHNDCAVRPCSLQVFAPIPLVTVVRFESIDWRSLCPPPKKNIHTHTHYGRIPDPKISIQSKNIKYDPSFCSTLFQLILGVFDINLKQASLFLERIYSSAMPRGGYMHVLIGNISNFNEYLNIKLRSGGAHSDRQKQYRHIETYIATSIGPTCRV